MKNSKIASTFERLIKIIITLFRNEKFYGAKRSNIGNIQKFRPSISQTSSFRSFISSNACRLERSPLRVFWSIQKRTIFASGEKKGTVKGVMENELDELEFWKI